MVWELDKKYPLCEQLCQQLCVSIANSEFKPGERLPSVRDVALEAGVNPNTVQRAFETLERQGVLYSIRGSGWFVSEDISSAQTVVRDMLGTKTSEYFMQMKALGLTFDEIKNYVEEWRE